MQFLAIPSIRILDGVSTIISRIPRSEAQLHSGNTVPSPWIHSTETGLKIYYMVRMYGDDESKRQYKGFTDLGLTKLAEQRAEKKRKANDEVEDLRKRLKEAEDKLAQ